MSLAHEVLNRAKDHGLEIESKGDRLRLRAAQPPPAELLTELAKHKPAIISLLQTAGECWSADDYRLLYEERAAIAEIDGQLTRHEAGNIAFDSCVVAWLHRHAVGSDPGRCAWCEKPDREGHTIVPFLAEDNGHTWLHPECRRDWFQQRRQMAVRALGAMGLHSPALRTKEGGGNGNA